MSPFASALNEIDYNHFSVSTKQQKMGRLFVDYGFRVRFVGKVAYNQKPWKRQRSK